ncbi:hypothetical protein JTB14_028844 [Gonioctena quinquepunctata]|nr:hypothetical protein JTB14_028844 [Gonioctena quinquepunctata]
MNAQMFDFKTPQTFLKPCNFVVQISNEDYIGKEAEISCNGDVSQTANQPASFNMNQLDQLDSSLPSTSKCSGHDVYLATVFNSKNNRKWDKKYFCIYCKKNISKLPRHLYTNHEKEPEVIKILSLPPKCRERMDLISEIQSRGIFFYNTITIKSGNGIIMPKRRPNPGSEQSVSKYIPCPSCFQLITKSYLSKHRNNCVFSQDSKGTHVRAQGMLLLPVGSQISSKFKETILSKIVGDDDFSVIRKDVLILTYGESEFHENRHYQRQYQRSNSGVGKTFNSREKN